ncbi:hypothetical protein B0J12DRAFT_704909 [Macrophomina phaseolina]|uniref:Methyltransferase type 11 domain-containing protein n=1 Tax=Macrophomina phaseolina TaxID=35725 RepID=A0ABQ8FU99_9PEZI|nr:hypothetical protein B0J12DRAFT_704909 [Macrophomina phaseolina]
MANASETATFQQPLDFGEIYRKNVFGSAESHSGNGSSLEQTATIRQLLPGLLARLGVQTLLDAPCGDFNWMRHVDLGGRTYIGADVVEELIANNRNAFPGVDFRCLDIVRDPLPRADLILCRDCLVHLRAADAVEAVRNFKRSGATYLLATTFTNTEQNEETFVRGLWRALNLQKPPFNLPEPLELFNENCTEAGTLFADKSLGLWDLRQVQL